MSNVAVAEAADSLRTLAEQSAAWPFEEARKLIGQKAELRRAEVAAAERHLERLRESRPESLETTSLHLDVLRDLKRIHSHICSVAYPVLEANGAIISAEVDESDPITLASPGTRPVAR